MSVLMEKLEDGRMLFNKEGLRDYLTDFLCDSAADVAKNAGPINEPIMMMIACTVDYRRDTMVVNMVDALFKGDGEPCVQAINPIYRAIFGMKLEELGGFFYGSYIGKE